MKGYITAMQRVLAQNGINEYELVDGGAIGNRVYDLSTRTETEVLNKPPHIAVICFGEYDLWYNTFKSADQFSKFYKAIIIKLQSAGSKVILCTPVAIEKESSLNNETCGNNNNYSNIIRSITADLHVPLVDLYKVFQLNEVEGSADKVIRLTDGAHLNNKLNELAAELIWKAIKEIE